MTIDIERFAGVDDFREYLNAPWRRDGKLYATNGHIMVEIPDDGREAAPFDKHPDCAGLFDKHTPGEFFSMPELPPAQSCRACEGKGVCFRSICADCDGNGEFWRGVHEYSCKQCDGEGYWTRELLDGEKASRCPTCDGFGEECGYSLVTKAGSMHFANRLLRVVSTLPGVEIANTTNDKKGGLWFRFEGGRGLVMPVNDPPAA